jgi:hypothetical protein
MIDVDSKQKDLDMYERKIVKQDGRRKVIERE